MTARPQSDGHAGSGRAPEIDPHSLRGRVIALAREGLTPPEIARRVEADPKRVGAIISGARRRGIALPYLRGPRPCGNRVATVPLPAETYAALETEADARGYRSVSRLVAATLGTIIADNLFTAILEE